MRRPSKGWIYIYNQVSQIVLFITALLYLKLDCYDDDHRQSKYHMIFLLYVMFKIICIVM